MQSPLAFQCVMLPSDRIQDIGSSVSERTPHEAVGLQAV